MQNQKIENNVEVYQKKKIGKYILMGFLILSISFGGAFFIGKTLLGSPVALSEQDSPGPFFESSEFTVNIADTNGRRFLITQFSVEVENKKVLEEIETKLSYIDNNNTLNDIKDSINNILKK